MTSIPSTAANIAGNNALAQGARAAKFLDGIWKRVKPMTHTNDLLLVVDSSRNLMWFSHHDQRILASDVHTEPRLRSALESCLPPNKDLATYLWTVISHFEDAHIPSNPGSFSFGGIEYRCRAHCLLNNGHRLIALVFSPVDDNAENGLFEYSDESSSSVNRMSDFESRREANYAQGFMTSNSSHPGQVNMSYGTMSDHHASGTGDFFPSLAKSEVTYYYSLLPRSEEGHFKDVDKTAQGKLPKSASSAVDIEVEDPDEIVQIVQSSTRQFSSSNLETAATDLRGPPGQSAPVRKPTSAVAPGHSCQECGTTQSPEWRKGPNGSKTLCNACGLRYAKRLRQR